MCCLLGYLGNLDIHISRQLAQQIQTDRKPTEKPNNKQACTNLKDLQMVLSGCMSTTALEGRKVYQVTSVLWLSRSSPSMLISIKHFSPTKRRRSHKTCRRNLIHRKSCPSQQGLEEDQLYREIVVTSIFISKNPPYLPG